jgi:hypothetical protein
MTTALQVLRPLRDRCKKVLLASAASGSVNLHYSGVTDRTMKAAPPELVRLSIAADDRQRVALRSGKTNGGLETCSGQSLQ